MSESPDPEDKSEAPSEKRLQQLREEGRTALSRDATTALTFATFLIAVEQSQNFIAHSVMDLTRRALGEHRPFEYAHLSDQLSTSWRVLLTSSAWLLLPIAAASIVASLLQTGLPAGLSPIRPGRGFAPLAKLSQLFGLQAWRHAGLNALKLIAVVVVLHLMHGDDIRRVRELGDKPLTQSLEEAGGILAEVVRTVAALFVAQGVVDYAWRRRELMQQARMSKDELKREAKEEMGSPEIKAKRRALAQRLLKRQVRKEVQGASVVVTNPTHYAVALRYEPGKSRAPRVVAKGVDHMAQQIKQLAAEHAVAIVENVPLARALHAQVPVGKEVPEGLYRAVAEVLAFVYRRKRQGRH